VPGFAERFPVQKVLFFEVDLRQMLGALLDLHTTRGAGGIASAIMIEGEPQLLGGIEQCRIQGDFAASALGMKKRHQRHLHASING
jgi:hypothetical protein